MGGWTAWGNHTACYPKSTDVKDYFIPLSRMFDYVTNTLIKTFWSKLDKPMNRRLIDTILDSANIWLNGLVGCRLSAGCQCGNAGKREPADQPDGGQNQAARLHDPALSGAGD